MATKRIAVDFDGTIAKTRFPVIVEPIPESRYLKKWQKQGHKIILWTSRTGKHQSDAIDWCYKELGLLFDEVAEGKKPNVDYFIDDKFPFSIHMQWEHLNNILGGK